jgi:hypothetical protein
VTVTENTGHMELSGCGEISCYKGQMTLKKKQDPNVEGYGRGK